MDESASGKEKVEAKLPVGKVENLRLKYKRIERA